MNILFWGLTISMIGKVLLATGVLWAHYEIAHERKIDKEVLKGFRVELILTIAGLLLIIGGYALEIVFYGFATNMLTCHDGACNAATAILSQ